MNKFLIDGFLFGRSSLGLKTFVCFCRRISVICEVQNKSNIYLEMTHAYKLKKKKNKSFCIVARDNQIRYFSIIFITFYFFLEFMIMR